MTAFWKLFRGEVFKLFSRRRTHLGFASFLLVECGLLWMLSLHRVKARMTSSLEAAGYSSSGDFLSGPTFALQIMMWTSLLLGALYLALVSGDIFAKEAEDGVLRMMLCRPITRARLVLAKALTCLVYTFALIAFIGLSALLVGLWHHGMGSLFAFAPKDAGGLFAVFGPMEGLWRYLLAIPVLSLSIYPICCVGLLLSCLPIKPSVATVLTLSIFFVDNILSNIPFLEGLREFFFTPRITSWTQVFQYSIPWETLIENQLWLAGANFTLIMMAVAIVESRDFKS